MGPVLLTGANGFIGRQVRAHLSALDLHCTTRGDAPNDGRWHQVDLRDADACARLVEEVRPRLLVHCAWNTEHGAFWHAEDNAQWLDAGKALFDAFVANGGERIVACGTCAEYSSERDDGHEEGEPIDADALDFPYARAKLALLRHLETLDVSWAWARIFLVYGPGEDRRRLVPSVISALLAGEEARCSSGRQRRDFLDVRDAGAAIARLAESTVEGVVNIGSGEPATIGDVARTLAAMTGREDLLRLGALPDREREPAVLVPDLTRQTDELGFRPARSLEKGLRDAIDTWSARG